jgi:hypothetical protein
MEKGIPENPGYLTSFFDVQLPDDLSNLTSPYSATSFADSETETLAHCNGSDQVYVDRQVVTWHNHLYSSGEHDFTCNVCRTEIELRAVLVVERSVASTFFLLQDVDLSLEFARRLL